MIRLRLSAHLLIGSCKQIGTHIPTKRSLVPDPQPSQISLTTPIVQASVSCPDCQHRMRDNNTQCSNLVICTPFSFGISCTFYISSAQWYACICYTRLTPRSTKIDVTWCNKPPTRAYSARYLAVVLHNRCRIWKTPHNTKQCARHSLRILYYSQKQNSRKLGKIPNLTNLNFPLSQHSTCNRYFPLPHNSIVKVCINHIHAIVYEKQIVIVRIVQQRRKHSNRCNTQENSQQHTILLTPPKRRPKNNNFVWSNRQTAIFKGRFTRYRRVQKSWRYRVSNIPCPRCITISNTASDLSNTTNVDNTKALHHLLSAARIHQRAKQVATLKPQHRRPFNTLSPKP